MGFIRGLFRFTIAVLITAIGVLIVMYEKQEIIAYADDLYQQFIAEAPEIPDEIVTYRQILGGAITIIGLVLAWFVLVPKRRPRSVTFTGTHGEVTIELEPVEATLERVAMKLPEVKNISIQLKPLEGNGRIQVNAIAILAKNADDDARMVTARVHNFLQIHTRKIVGLQEVDAKLTVKKFNMNMKSVKPEPLLLEAPDQPAAPAPVAAPAPAAFAPPSAHTPAPQVAAVAPQAVPQAAPVPEPVAEAVPDVVPVESHGSAKLIPDVADEGRISKY